MIPGLTLQRKVVMNTQRKHLACTVIAGRAG